MNYSIRYIADALREAREGKQLSQRAVSGKTGVPQARLSKIERGLVDLRLSTLIELARLLDLEVMLVPRALVPAVRGIVRSPDILWAARSRATREAQKELTRIRNVIDSLEGSGRSPEDTGRLETLVSELSNLQLGARHLETIRGVSAKLKSLPKAEEGAEQLRNALRSLQRVRNAAVHDATADTRIRPAYSLEDEDTDG